VSLINQFLSVTIWSEFVNLGLLQNPSSQSHSIDSASLENLSAKELIRRGNIRMEKCELKEAGRYFEIALEQAKNNHDYRGISDALAHLLRHSSEIGNEALVQRWVNELETFLAQKFDSSTGQNYSPNVWYCRGIVAVRNAQFKKAQVLFHRFWRELENEENLNNGQTFPISVRSDFEIRREGTPPRNPIFHLSDASSFGRTQFRYCFGETMVAKGVYVLCF